MRTNPSRLPLLLLATLLAGMPASPGASAEGTTREAALVASGTMELSLAECVALAVRRNTAVKLAYLDRVLEKYSEQTGTTFAFQPRLSMGATAARSGTRAEAGEKSSSRQESLAASARLDQRLPTGGQIGAQWQPRATTRTRRSTGDVSDAGESRTSNWSLNLSQPLLRGAGESVAALDVRQARIEEHLHVLRLKQTLMDTVTSVVKSYRALVQARWDAEINRISLQRARELVETNRLLISLGRLAAQDIIQSEADVANKELALETALNAFDRARLDLLRLLDLSKFLRIVPDETLECPPFSFTEEQVLALVHGNQPDFLANRHAIDLARFNLIKARDNMKAELSLTASLGDSRVASQAAADSASREWNVGMTLDLPVWGGARRDLRAGLLDAENEARKADILFRKLSDNLEIECLDAVRQIRTLERQIVLAGRARELSERKLAVEREKFSAGRSSNFQLVTYQDDLRNARIQELSSKISYLNALSDLDLFMGTAVDTWGIDLNADRPGEGPRDAAVPAAPADKPARPAPRRPPGRGTSPPHP